MKCFLVALALNLLATTTMAQVTIDNATLTELTLNGANRVAPDTSVPLWTIEFYDREAKQTVTVDAHAAERIGERGWSVQHDGEQIAHIETWTSEEDGAAQFHVAVIDVDERYEIDRLWYPHIPLAPLGDPDDDKFVTPTAYGHLIERIHEAEEGVGGRKENVFQAILRSRYPSKLTALQMQYYYDAGGGMLFMTPDETRRLKEFVLDKRGGGICASWIHFVDPDQGRGERFELPYAAEVRWVDGDWYDAAQVYRSWAVGQSWADERLDERADVPDWLPGLPSWVRIPRDPSVAFEEKTQWPLQWVEAVGGPMGLHWYGWDETGGPNNIDWPKHFPPHPQASDLVQRYHDAGLYVMPYTNGRIMGIGGPLWDEYKDEVLHTRDGEIALIETWRDYATKEEAEQAEDEGREVKEFRGGWWHINYNFGVGSMASDKYRRNLREHTLSLVLEHNFDAVYMDQVGVWAARDFHAARPEAYGDPTIWRENTQAMYEDILQTWLERDRPAALVSEYNGEGIMPHMHGGLTVSSGLLRMQRTIPLFPAVYHEYFACIGWDDNPGDLARAPQYYLQQQCGMPLVFGSHLGWISYVMPRAIERHPDLVACYRDAVTLRREHPAILGYGKMLRPPHVEGVAHLPAPSEHRLFETRTWPAILSGFFQRVPDGNAAMAVMINWTTEPRRGIMHLDLSELPKPLTATFIDGRDIDVFDGDEASVLVELEPFTVSAIMLKHKAN